jgi:hypothetical protein
MKVYNQEVLDGVADIVKAQSSVAYCSQAVLSKIDEDTIVRSSDLIRKLQASSNPNQIDLYYMKSVLVSTGWNKNDDVFDNNQTWSARNTPEDKQFNFMHNENDIIGHITGSYVVDREGNKISADQTDAPAEFDIITEAVLYNSWSNPENKDRMNKIIQEIEQGKWFVSMECLFAGFDYSVIDQTGNAKTVARNEDSAFLTKHLRAYGGTGEYEGYKIGRSLRDISFSGKGLVSKPANPRSIILDSSRAFSVNEQYTISNNVPKGEFNMSDKNLTEKLDETTVEVVASSETVTVDVDTLNKEVAERVSLLETTLAEKDSALKTFEERVANLEASLLIKEKELAAMDSEMKDMKKKEKNLSRKNSMVKCGFDESEAEEVLPLYDTVDDAAFETILAVYKKKMAQTPVRKENLSKDEKNESTNPKAEVTEVKASEEEVNASLFAGVNSTEATLVDASDVNDELEATRASVAEWLTENVLRK